MALAQSDALRVEASSGLDHVHHFSEVVSTALLDVVFVLLHLELFQLLIKLSLTLDYGAVVHEDQVLSSKCLSVPSRSLLQVS